MVFRSVVCLVALVVWSGSVGQETSKQKATSTPIATSTVTVEEVIKTMRQCEKAVRAVLGMKPVTATSLPANKAKPASRELVVDQFYHLFELAKPEFKYTPRPLNFDKKLLKPPTPKSKEKLEKLISFGAVSASGPLATSTKDTLTIQQFGEATGLILARLAELTHTPDSRFSPYMNQGGG